jgi:cell division protein FtsL
VQNLGGLCLQREKMDEKVILEEVYDAIEGEKLSTAIIRNVIIFVLFVLMLSLPKIYIATNIYYTSVKINKLLNEYYSLKAENSILKSKIEKLKFKNRLTSTLF